MNCKNCHTELHEHDDYCPSCGAKVIRKRLTFKNLFEHISETFFNYDNKLLRTLIDLFRRPEAVIDGYIKGIRKRYVNPISFFGLAITISGLSIFILKKYFIDDIDFSIYMVNSTDENAFKNIQSTLFEYNSLFYAFLVPFFALMSWIVFLNKKYNFTEHIVLFLYSMSLLMIGSVIISQLFLFTMPTYYAYTGFGFYLFIFIYHCYLFKRIFELTYAELILKTLIFLILFVVFYVIISILLFVILFATGIANIEDFRPK